jgi:hypothetical protein
MRHNMSDMGSIISDMNPTMEAPHALNHRNLLGYLRLPVIQLPAPGTETSKSVPFLQDVINAWNARLQFDFAQQPAKSNWFIYGGRTSGDIQAIPGVQLGLNSLPAQLMPMTCSVCSMTQAGSSDWFG